MSRSFETNEALDPSLVITNLSQLIRKKCISVQSSAWKVSFPIHSIMEHEPPNVHLLLVQLKFSRPQANHQSDPKAKQIATEQAHLCFHSFRGGDISFASSQVPPPPPPSHTLFVDSTTPLEKAAEIDTERGPHPLEQACASVR